MDMGDRSLLQSVLAIAGEAGRAILEIYQADAPLAVITKADASPVTAADHAAHRIILAGLQALTPEIPVLSEESDAAPFAERARWPRYWLVDPLDGTKEFINRTGEFTVNIALVEHHEPVLGVVAVPVSGVAYAALKGRGAFRIERGQWHAIHCRKASPQHLAIAGSRRHGAERLQAIVQRMEAAGIRVDFVSMGSALKICLVAEGRADCYPRLGPTSEWDTAAAQAVLAEAGGQVVDGNFQPLRYNHKESLLNPHFHALGDLDFDWRFWLDDCQ